MISHKTKITTVRHWTLKHTTYDEDTDAIVDVGVRRKGGNEVYVRATLVAIRLHVKLNISANQLISVF